LFRSEIPNLVKVVSDAFTQLSIDDKISSSVSEFGYMSVHLICQLPKHFAGPRYDDIKGLQFEVQIRTIAMHAWAAISHFIDYKHEADVPADLRKSLNALSALFYLADTQFETFAREAEQSRRVVEEAINTQAPSNDLGLNLDTLKAVAGRIFPGRRFDEKSPKWSELLTEISEAGFDSTNDLANVLTKDPEYVDNYEKMLGKTQARGPHFTQIGAIRVTLRKYSPEYAKVYEKKPRRPRTGQRPLR
jgi:putative GTP pyrophosphokinase